MDVPVLAMQLVAENLSLERGGRRVDVDRGARLDPGELPRRSQRADGSPPLTVARRDDELGADQSDAAPVLSEWRGGDAARYDRCGRIPGVRDWAGTDSMAGIMKLQKLLQISMH